VTTISSFPYAGRYNYTVKHITATHARVKLNYLGDTQITTSWRNIFFWKVFNFVVDDQEEITISTKGARESNNYCNANEYSTSLDTRILFKPVQKDNSDLFNKMITTKYDVK